MPQPDYVPLQSADVVRAVERLPAPLEWFADRPGEITGTRQPDGPQMGNAGPDQGYGIKLARHMADRLQLTAHEHVEDAIAGCLPVALKRAALFGRAPVIYDFEVAYTLWGFLGDAPTELVAHRQPMFSEASHHYEDQRAIADAVPDSTLRMTPAQVTESLGEWRSLLSISG